MFEVEPGLVTDRVGWTLIGDKNYFERQLAQWDIRRLRSAHKGEAERAGS